MGVHRTLILLHVLRAHLRVHRTLILQHVLRACVGGMTHRTCGEPNEIEVTAIQLQLNGPQQVRTIFRKARTAGVGAMIHHIGEIFGDGMQNADAGEFVKWGANNIVTGGDLVEESKFSGLIGLQAAQNVDGVLCVYEKTDEKSFHKSKEVRLPGGGIRSISISPSEETLCVTTSSAQLLRMSLVSSDLINSGSDGPKSLFEPLLTPFHNGTIHGLDVCLRKPLVATCSADRSVRVWNYVDRSVDLQKQFPEEVGLRTHASAQAHTPTRPLTHPHDIPARSNARVAQARVYGCG